MKKITVLLFLNTILMVSFTQGPSKKFAIARLAGIPAKTIEIAIDESAKLVTVTARGIKSEGVKGCTSCNVAGKLSYTNNMPAKDPGNPPSPFAVGIKGVKVILTKEPTGSTRTVYTAITDAEGYFGFKDIPAGNYSMLIHDQVIATGLLVPLKEGSPSTPAKSAGGKQ